ncbi:MAG: ATP-binding cassette domain-containing protein [Woeseiaceae bacterium]|nr:ATP-binding cassette domain-containing protein [Woeseiaceae bacterium]
MQDVPLIEIRNATLWRGSTRVFCGLDLTIRQGERIAILGPNGSGKTTLLKTINREIYPVVEPDSYVRILGRSDWNVWDLRKHIGILSHDLQQRYPPGTRAIDVVTSGFHSSIGVHGTVASRVDDDQRSRAAEVLDDLDMHDHHETPLKKMSTGQQRRCLLARALVHRPKTLILDEPTSGLDFAASFDFLSRIRRLQDCNVILVTHHLNEVPPEIDRVVVLKDGEIAADGSKKEVLTGTLLSEVYETPITVAEIDGHYLAYPG